MKYFCGIDESGISNSYKNLLNQFLETNTIKKDKRFFLLTMILIDENEYKNFKQKFNELKLSFFKTSKIKLHTSDFLNLRKQFFNFSLEESKKFFFEFLNLIDNTYFTIFQVIVDNQKHFERYRERSYNPYFLSINYFIEMLIKTKPNKNIEVFMEGRGYNLDIDLLKRLYNKHNIFKYKIDLHFINKNAKDNYELIEIADFVAYFLFLNLRLDKNYLNKVKLLSDENLELIVMIRKILLMKFKEFSYKKIN